MADRRQTQIIVVQVERVIFRKQDTNWCIIQTRPQASGDAPLDMVGSRLCCKGVVGFDVAEGDRLQLEGYFARSEFSGGTEFTFQTAIPHLPTDMLALLHYAVSITKGLGEVREAEIWGKYGARWIEHEKLDIPGVPERVQFFWAETLRKLGETKQQTQAITFLLSHGCTLNMANVAWAEWKENTIGTVQGDCYQLAQLPHYGFKKVDGEIRHHFGIADNDERRRDAALLYVMGELTAQGSTLIGAQLVYDECKALVPMQPLEFGATCERLNKAGKLTGIDGNLLALTRDVEVETRIYEAFKESAACS